MDSLPCDCAMNIVNFHIDQTIDHILNDIKISYRKRQRVAFPMRHDGEQGDFISSYFFFVFFLGFYTPLEIQSTV